MSLERLPLMAKHCMHFWHYEPFDHTTEAGDGAISGSKFKTPGTLSLHWEVATAPNAIFLSLREPVVCNTGSSTSNALFIVPGSWQYTSS